MAPTRQRSFRWSQETLAALDQRARERGEPGSRLAERLVDEGLRMEEHPGIVFRDGPTGRRAALAVGPDVWELVRFVKGLDMTGERAVAATCRALDLSTAQVETALRYYADHPGEIDDRIRLDEERAERAEAAWKRRHSLLG
ncbi:MAG TPA: hypothetical protein VHA73_00825 [Acidimicrobiales bacterium]|jgi:hypothetical protein|nr:hypothetical protein [Acidimicrobiales bacterium]